MVPFEIQKQAEHYLIQTEAHREKCKNEKKGKNGMKQKEKFKRFMAFLLAAVMILSMCATAFAKETSAPSAKTETESNQEETISEAVQSFLSAVAAIEVPEEINEETGTALNEQIGAAQDAYDALSAEELKREDVQEAAAAMQKAVNALTGGAEPTAVAQKYVTLRPTDALGYSVGAAKVQVGDTVKSYNGNASYTVRSVNGQEITVWVYLDNLGSFYFPAASSLWENAVSVEYVYWSGDNDGEKSENGSGMVGNGAALSNVGLATYYINKVSSSGGDSGSTTLQVNTVFTGDVNKTVNGMPFEVTVGSGYSPVDYATGFDKDNYTYSFTKAERNFGNGLFKLYSSSSSGNTSVTTPAREFYPASGANVVTVYYTATKKTQTIYNYAINYDTQGGSEIASTTQSSTATSVTLNVTSDEPAKAGYVFKGWAESEGSVSADAKNSYTLTSSNPTKTLYAVWEEDKTITVAGSSTLNITKEFTGDITSVPENFRMEYSYKNLATNETVNDVIELTRNGNILTGSIQLPYYNNVETGTTYPLSIKEVNADVEGYNMVISGSGAMNDIDQTNDCFKFSISATNESTLNRTVTNTYTSVPDWDNLKVNKSADKQTAKPGEEVTYSIEVTNNTGKTLKDIKVSDTLNENLTFVSAGTEGQYDEEAGVITWTITSLANGQSADLTLKAKVKDDVSDGTTIGNTAVISGAEDEDGNTLPDGSDPKDDVYITVENPEPASGLEVTKTADKTEVKPGESITYTIKVNNTADQEITGIMLKDYLPNEITGNMEISSNDGINGFTSANNVITWKSFSLAANASKSVKVTVKISENVENGTIITNKAEASADGYEPVKDQADTTVNTGEPTPVKPDWDKLAVEKTVDKQTVKPGENVIYTIKVTNNTGKDLTDITISDTLDQNLTFSSAGAEGKYDEALRKVTWMIGSLENGKSTKVTLEASISKDAADKAEIKNTAIISGAEADDEKLPDDKQPDDDVVLTVDDPDTPDDGKEPGNPDTPDDGKQPVNPSTPDDGKQPADPGTSGDTNQPGNPSTPGDANQPGSSDVTDNTGDPGSSDVTDNTSPNAGSDASDDAKQSDNTKQSGKSDASDNTDQEKVQLKETPKTGDTSNVFLWGALLSVSLLGVVVTLYLRKKRL